MERSLEVDEVSGYYLPMFLPMGCRSLCHSDAEVCVIRMPKFMSLGCRSLRHSGAEVYVILQKPHCKEIWVNPDPKIRKMIVDKLPDAVMFNSYKQSLEAFNHGMWSLALLASSKTVERICKIHFSNTLESTDVIGLFDKLRLELQSVPELKDILEPFLNLGEALRIGRDSDAFFDLKVESNGDLAVRVLDLTEFLIQWIYILSGKISEVDRSMSELGFKDTEGQDITDRIAETFS